MAFDRHTANTSSSANNSNRPFLPRVATGKGAVAPITPRLAAQHLRASPSPSVVSHTPSRPFAGAGAAGGASVVEDVNTPVKNLLNSNITPRSSHRKSRLETGSNVSTPSGTPLDNAGGAGFRRRPANGTAADERGVVTENGSPAVQAAVVQKFATASDVAAGSSSNFFHASEVGTIEKTKRPAPKKTPTFFYANGGQEEQGVNRGSSHRSPSPTSSAVSAATGMRRILYADGAVEEIGSRPLASPVVASADTRPQSSRRQSTTSSTTPTTHFPFRPPSPQKSGFHLTFRKGASQVLPARSPIASPQPFQTHSPPNLSRQGSSKKAAHSQQTPQPHIRDSSLSSLDTESSSRKASLAASELPPRSAFLLRDSPTIASQPFTPIERAVAFDASEKSPQATQGAGQPTSPNLASPSHRSLAQVPPNFAEAAANARRERKVLDLEISNSSLLAINRQLEREVRRQKLELRRFRRLSRAGRLSSIGSLLPDFEANEHDDELSDAADALSDEAEEDEDVDEESPDVSLGSDELSDQGYAVYQGSAARLEKDERRLRLDLDRHRQILVDSQKMNQSLKRCMAWTEEMIAEGRKALAYKINVSDVRLGGRVLQEDDVQTSLLIRAVDDDHTDDAADADTDGRDGEHEQPDGDEGEDVAPEPRQGLLGSWSPPSSTTPLTTLVNAADGLFGLALHSVPGHSPENSSNGNDKPRSQAMLVLS